MKANPAVKSGTLANRELPCSSGHESKHYIMSTEKLGGSSSSSKPGQGCRQQQAVVGSAQTVINQLAAG